MNKYGISGKYGVIGADRNSTEVYAVCETKEEALLTAQRLNEQGEGRTGIQFNAIYGNFDEQGNLRENRYLLLYSIPSKRRGRKAGGNKPALLSSMKCRKKSDRKESEGSI